MSLVQQPQNEADDVLVIDAGDASHAQIITTLVVGESIAQIYNTIGYDIRTDFISSKR